MTSQPGKQIIAMHILPSISRSKGNHTMKFGKKFLKFLNSSCCGETIPRPFSEKTKLSKSLDQ